MSIRHITMNHFIVFSLSILLFGCYLMEPESTGLDIRTNKVTYAPDDLMEVTFTNDSDRRYYLLSSGCITHDEKPLPGLSYERRIDGGWVNVGGPACPRIMVPPVELKPSDTYTVVFNAYVGAMEFVPGRYRLRFYFADSDNNITPPENEHFSNEFRIK